MTSPCLASLQPQPLLQPGLADHLAGARAAAGGGGAAGLLVPLAGPQRPLLPAALGVRTLLLGRARLPVRHGLPLHPAEVRGRPRARRAAAVLRHGGVLHDGARGRVLAPRRRRRRRRGRLAGGEDRPAGHPGPAAQHPAVPHHGRHGAVRRQVERGGGGVVVSTGTLDDNNNSVLTPPPPPPPLRRFC